MDNLNSYGNLNIRDLHKRQFQINKNRQKVFDILLDRCHRRIISFSQHSAKACVFNVPEYVYGLPLYNQSDAYKFIYQRLKEEGFTIKVINNNNMLISWDIDESKECIPCEHYEKFSNTNLPYISKGYFLS